MTKQYYIQRTASPFLGNAPVWWRKGDAGYTAYVQNAKRFSIEEVETILQRSPDKYAAYDCDFIDSRLHAVFDHQDFGKQNETAFDVSEYAKIQTSTNEVLQRMCGNYKVLTDSLFSLIEKLDEYVTDEEAEKMIQIALEWRK